jgi:4-amino-4-deoxy-L-arabinose transferase-like glycosyltransferase
MVLKETLAAELAPALSSGEFASVESQKPCPPRGRLVRAAEWAGLLLVVALAGWLRLWHLAQNGWGTTYYTAAVRSGLESWHNFFYNSLDPGGFVCVDKPPVAIWVQVLSAKLFGFNPYSVLVPQAVMGTLSVLIIWYLTRRCFGPLAAFLAALALALTPISVAVERTNNTDACLAFVLLLSAWALIRATEKGSLWLLLLAMFLVGIGFNTKMLAAFVVLPIYYVVYVLGAPVRWRSRLGDLALATFVVFSVALSWAVLYDLTPEDERPYADSTQNNSMLTLIVEHNGVDRFIRRGRGRRAWGARAAAAARPQPLPGGQNPVDPNGRPADAAGPAGQAANPMQQRRGRSSGIGRGLAQGNPFAPGQGNGDGRRGRAGGGPGFAGGGFLPPGGPGGFGGRGGPGGPGGAGWGGGSPVGPWRLAHPHMAGQMLWFFPLAFVGFFAAAFQTRWSWPLGPNHQMLLLWLGWLVTYTVVYSFAGGIFHDYYVVTMAAPMAALTGIGGAALWKSFHSVPGRSVAAVRRRVLRSLSQGWRPLLLPLAIWLTAGWQALIWLNYPELAKWTVPALFIGATAGGLGLLALRGSWWAPVLTLSLFAGIAWLWSRDSSAPDILTVAAGELEKARVVLRDAQGFDAFKKLYTKFSPDMASLVPDLRRQAPLVTAPLLRGCAIACGCLLVIFLLAKWRPILAKAAAVGVAICFLVLYVGPGVWALSPLWGRSGILPSADASVFERAIRERQQQAQEAEHRAEQAAQLTVQALMATSWVGPPSLVAAPVTFVGNDFVASARNRRGFPGGRGGLRGPGRMPGMMPPENERSREEREKLVAFLKANDHGERWLLAVSGSGQASAFIIEDGLSVMPIGGFNGGSPTFGTEPEEINARLAQLVGDGEIRFFQVGGGRGGFRGGFGGRAGGFGPPPGPGGAGLRGGPPGGPGRGSAVVSQWIFEQVEKGKAKRVARKLYTLGQFPLGNRRGGRGFGMMGGGDLYDLRPELGLQEPNQQKPSE